MNLGKLMGEVSFPYTKINTYLLRYGYLKIMHSNCFGLGHFYDSLPKWPVNFSSKLTAAFIELMGSILS